MRGLENSFAGLFVVAQIMVIVGGVVWGIIGMISYFIKRAASKRFWERYRRGEWP